MPRITANKDNSEWEERHLKNIARYERLIDEIFKSAAQEAASIAGVAGRVDSGKPFSFSDYPATKRRVDKLLADVQSGVEAVVVNGIEAEWKLANEKNDELCGQVFGESAGSLTEAQRRQYYSTNSRALEQFQARKISGLSLSERVWRYTDQFKDEIEMGIDIGIRDGLSADRLSRQLRQYLNYPDKLFRRVRDEHGNLVLSRRASAFHPGQGVYRSSYKNARRLAATETNIAYRSADYERWKRLDFVVGIHVILSNNHTTRDGKGRKVPLYDICNELSGEDENDEKGKYPKDFKFTGWHPQCRCHAISILKTQEEMDADNRRIMEGGEPTGADESANAVSDVPAAFTKWVEANADRIEGAKSLPYFISDNRGVVDGILGRQAGGIVGAAPQGRSVRDIAEERHAQRTPERELELRRYWQDKVMKFTPEQLKNFEDIEKELGVKRGLMMTFEEANALRANPNYGGTEFIPDPKGLYRDQQGNTYSKNPKYKEQYAENCASCVVANELRRLGFDVEAIGKKKGNMADFLSHHTEYAWKNSNGYVPASTKARGIFRDMEITVREMQNKMKDVGRYHIKWRWKRRGGHIITCEKLHDGTFRYYDPQNGKVIADFVKYAMDNGVDISGLWGDGFEFLRVDNLFPNASVIKQILRKCKNAGKR